MFPRNESSLKIAGGINPQRSSRTTQISTEPSTACKSLKLKMSLSCLNNKSTRMKFSSINSSKRPQSHGSKTWRNSLRAKSANGPTIRPLSRIWKPRFVKSTKILNVKLSKLSDWLTLMKSCANFLRKNAKQWLKNKKNLRLRWKRSTLRTNASRRCSKASFTYLFQHSQSVEKFELIGTKPLLTKCSKNYKNLPIRLTPARTSNLPKRKPINR